MALKRLSTALALALTVAGARPRAEATPTICLAPDPWRSADQLRSDEFKRATAVFAGRVIAMDRFKVTMRVDISWKGPSASEIVLGTGAHANSDGTVSFMGEDFSFEAGKSYLVWLYGNGPQFVASGCSRTAQLPFAAREFSKLDRLAKRQVITPVR